MSYIPFKVMSGTVVLEFGNESDIATTTITSTELKNTNIFSMSFVPAETTETSLDDFKLNAVQVGVQNIIDSTSFDIIGNAVNNASGNYTVNYFITHS